MKTVREDYQTETQKDVYSELKDESSFDDEYVLWLENKTSQLKEQLAETRQNYSECQLLLKEQLDKTVELQEQLAVKSEALEYAESGHLAIHKDCDELYLKIAEKEKELIEVFFLKIN